MRPDYLGEGIALRGPRVATALHRLEKIRCPWGVGVDMRDAELISVFGDDSVIFGYVKAGYAPYIFEHICNLESKILKFQTPEFCGKFWLTFEDRWVVVPNPFKLLLKFGRRDLVNWTHVEAYRVSTLDNIRPYSDVNVADALAEALSERYGCNRTTVDGFLGAITMLVRTRPNFNLLFYTVPGGRYCHDVSLPKLEI